MQHIIILVVFVAVAAAVAAANAAVEGLYMLRCKKELEKALFRGGKLKLNERIIQRFVLESSELGE